MQIKAIVSQKDFDFLLSQSGQNPVLLAKLSPSCSISMAAQEALQEFVKDYQGHTLFYSIDVIAAKPLARALAEQVGVRHESPQVLLFHKGSVVWHTSHRNINRANLTENIGKL